MHAGSYRSRSPTVPKQVEVSVIVPVRNDESHIRRQLDALESQKTLLPWELVIADNGSQDATVTIAAEYRGRIPDLRTVPAHSERGAAFARNEGARSARGNKLLFCDADDQV